MGALCSCLTGSYQESVDESRIAISSHHRNSGIMYFLNKCKPTFRPMGVLLSSNQAATSSATNRVEENSESGSIPASVQVTLPSGAGFTYSNLQNDRPATIKEGKLTGSQLKEEHMGSRLNVLIQKFDVCECELSDEDVCPTCLEDYTDQNPKIIAHCSHHYHLGCIYDWLERSETCPACRKVMVFDERA